MTGDTGRFAGIVFPRIVFHGVPWACLVILAAAAAVTGPAWSATLAPVPWIVALAGVGLAHGAADFAVSRRAWHGRPLVVLWMGYTAIMAAVAAAFAAAPLPVLTLFAVLSCWHFGLADADLEEPPPADQGERALAAAGRGAAALAIPLVVRPAATAAAAADLVRLVMPDSAAIDARPTPGGVLTLGLAIGGVGVAALVVDATRDLRGGGSRVDWPRRLADLAAISALGSLTDPLFSVGTYFLVWHAWRQMQPLAAVVAGRTPRSGRELVAAVAAIHAAALPLLVPTWAALAVAWWDWSPDHSARDLALLSIGAYLVVTPAHALLGDLLRATGDRGVSSGAGAHPHHDGMAVGLTRRGPASGAGPPRGRRVRRAASSPPGPARPS